MTTFKKKTIVVCKYLSKNVLPISKYPHFFKTFCFLNWEDYNIIIMFQFCIIVTRHSCTNIIECHIFMCKNQKPGFKMCKHRL